jgi:hypothetical protein
MSTYYELLENVQTEFLNGVKAAQDLSLQNLNAVSGFAARVPTVDTKDAVIPQLPTPTEIVERSFAFAYQLMDLNKAYLVRMAEFATEAQKQWTETAKRVAEASSSKSPSNNKRPEPAKN